MDELSSTHLVLEGSLPLLSSSLGSMTGRSRCLRLGA